MYHITKQKGGLFQVTLKGKNGEILSISEGLKTKQSAFKNVAAQLKTLPTLVRLMAHVSDDTLKVPKKYKLYEDGVKYFFGF